MVTETSDETLAEELGDFLEAQAAGLASADWRRNVPAGTVLAEAEMDGHKVQLTQGKTGVQYNGRDLPARTPVYDTRSGVISYVPTAQLGYQLGKRRQDGSRVYSLRKPEGIEEPTPIADTCQICYRSRGNKHRNFFSEFDLLNHMQVFHEREWNAMERDRDIRERKEEAGRLENLMLMFASAMRPDIAAQLPEEVRSQIEGLQAQAQPRRKRGE